MNSYYPYFEKLYGEPPVLLFHVYVTRRVPLVVEGEK